MLQDPGPVELSISVNGTRLLNHGVPMTTVSRCAGHVNSKITESFYAHLEDSTILSQVHMAMS